MGPPSSRGTCYSTLPSGCAGSVPSNCRRPSPPATARAKEAADTDWAEIATIYGRLAAMTPSAVVELNRAVAVAMVDGPAAGLDLIDRLDADGALAGYYLLPAARADLLRRLQRHEDAADAYRQALALVGTVPERRYLESRLRDMMAG